MPTVFFNASNNNFTDMYRSLEVDALSGDMEFENNAIEHTKDFSPTGTWADVIVQNANGSELIFIDNNKFQFTLNSSITRYCTYVANTTNFMYLRNSIKGYGTGIYVDGYGTGDVQTLVRGEIYGNEIDDFDEYGIYINDLIEYDPTLFLEINENIIRSKRADQDDLGTAFTGVGIYSINTIGQNLFYTVPIKVYSNCIFDTDDAIVFENSDIQNQLTIPELINNYLYNFSNSGMSFTGFLGNIGKNAAAPCSNPNTEGRNSFISNNKVTTNVGTNAAYDIMNHTVGAPITLEGNWFLNYGVSWTAGGAGAANVTIPGGCTVDEYYSTAKCGDQVQGKKLPEYMTRDQVVSHYFGTYYPLETTVNGFKLRNDFREWLSNYSSKDALSAVETVESLLRRSEQMEDADLFVNTVEKAELLTQSELTWKEYRSQLTNETLETAMSYLQGSSFENQYYTLNKGLELTALELAINGPNDDILNRLETTSELAGPFGNMAISQLMKYRHGHEYLLPTARATSALPTGMRSQSDLSGIELQIFPNPANSILTVLLNEEEAKGRIDILTITGRVIQTSQVVDVSNKVVLNINELPAGLYILQHTQKNGTISTASFSKE